MIDPECTCIRPITAPDVIVVRKASCPDHGRVADPETWAAYDREDAEDAAADDRR
jgi:hypothetical protein